MSFKVRYIDKNITKLEKFKEGDLVDLRVSAIWVNGVQKHLPAEYNAGDIVFVRLGFAMKMPEGCTAYIYPRSSTFKNYGVILTNGVGRIDNSYKGNNDEWCGMFYALKDGRMNHNDRILQFEVGRQTMNGIEFEEVEELESTDRGGYGSTGVK